MSAGQKYRRTNFEEDEIIGSTSGDVTPPGVTYSPVVAFSGRTSFCQRRTLTEKTLLCAVIVLSIIVFILVIVLSSHNHIRKAIERKRNETEIDKEPNLCVSKTCITVASSILNALDPSVKPCDDFYQYACGNWIKSHPIPQGESRWDTFGVLRRQNEILMKNLLETSPNTSLSAAERKARSYYSSCLDQNGTIEVLGATPLQELIKWLGGWAVSNVSGVFNLSQWNLQKTLEIVHGFGLNCFFAVWVSDDEKVPTRNVIQLDQSGLTLQRDQYLNKSIKDDKILSAYLRFMTDLGLLLGGSENETVRLMIDVIEFERSIANTTTPMQDRRDNEKLYNKKNIRQLQQLAPFINWQQYFSSLFSVTSYSIDDTQPVIVRAPEFLTQLSELVTKTLRSERGKITLQNYMIWNVVKSSCSSLSRAFRETKKEFNSVLFGTTGDGERWRTCVSDTESVLGFALGSIFIQKTFREGSKQAFFVLGSLNVTNKDVQNTYRTRSVLKVNVGFIDKEAENMIEAIRLSFKSNLPKLSWMQSDTQEAAAEKKVNNILIIWMEKVKAIEKILLKIGLLLDVVNFAILDGLEVDSVMNMIGFPQFILNQSELDLRYEELKVSSDEYFVNGINSMKYSMKRNLDKLMKPPDKTNWNMAPSVVNAYYSPTKNQIVFPAGILQAPFFDVSIPPAINFGAIGVVMGHELTHGFDDQGREYDKNGVLGQWWSNSSILKFKERTQCMIDQYSNFSEYGENIRGKQTLGENIADNGGLKSAYYAYKNWTRDGKHEIYLPGLDISQEQLFFLSFAQVWCTNSRPEDYHMSILGDVHSPNKFRVIGPLSNSREFSRVFHCPENSRMNPAKKCEVW